MPELSKEEKELAGIILGVMLAIGAAITIARHWFPYFLIGSVVLLVILIIAGLIEFFFRDHDYLDIWDYFSTYFGAAFIVCLICTGITYEIGYGLVGGSSFGQASLEVYNSFTGAEQALQDSINQMVEENCKLLPPEQCQLLRTTAKTAQTVQEISDYADQLKTLSNVVD